jgi:hypothetical protein
MPTIEAFKQQCSDEKKSLAALTNYDPESEFTYPSDLIDFLDKVIRPVMPDFLIINQGFWPHKQLRTNSTFTNLFLSTAKSASKKLVSLS